jgi:hypothetical protein
MSNQKCTAFYSWQSDRPNNINRGFIEKALEIAAKHIRDDDSIAIDPVIDRDTSGVPGSPDIAHTILAKIDQAQIFVGDVSIINNSAEARPSPNPNVLIELGYALKTMGPERVILVMNTAFGGPEQLPFDLRARRTVKYRAIEGEKDRSLERRSLESQLTEALRAVLEHLTVLKSEGRAKVIAEIRKLRQSRLDKIVAGEMPVKVATPAKLVLQIIPLSPIDPAIQYKVAALGQDRNDIQFHIMTHELGCNVWSPNFEGFAASRQLERDTGIAELHIQFLRNGSVEYADMRWFRHSRENNKPIMSSVEHERSLINSLPHIFNVQKQLGIKPPLAVGLSLLSVRDYILNVDFRLLFAAIPGQPANRFDRENVVLPEVIIDTFDVDPAQVLKPAFDAIWNAAGWPESMNYDPSGNWVGQRN